MKKILLVGAGGHAESCIDVLEKEKKFKIIGLVDNKKKVGSKILGYRVVGQDKDLKILKKKANYALVTIGQIGVTSIRKKIFLKLKKLGFKIPTIISSNSYVSKYSNIGEGTIIHHGAVVNTSANIGTNCIINSKALIEHNSIIGDHTHIATAAIINGNVEIGEECFIGSSSTIRNNIKIKKQTFVKMGAKVS